MKAMEVSSVQVPDIDPTKQIKEEEEEEEMEPITLKFNSQKTNRPLKICVEDLLEDNNEEEKDVIVAQFAVPEQVKDQMIFPKEESESLSNFVSYESEVDTLQDGNQAALMNLFSESMIERLTKKAFGFEDLDPEITEKIDSSANLLAELKAQLESTEMRINLKIDSNVKLLEDKEELLEDRINKVKKDLDNEIFQMTNQLVKDKIELDRKHKDMENESIRLEKKLNLRMQDLNVRLNDVLSLDARFKSQIEKSRQKEAQYLEMMEAMIEIMKIDSTLQLADERDKR